MHANYRIEECTADLIVIRDLGPHDQHKTVTNDAEHVVAELYAEGHLPRGRMLLYYDSEGELAELRHDRGRFLGFAFPSRIVAAAGELPWVEHD